MLAHYCVKLFFFIAVHRYIVSVPSLANSNALLGALQCVASVLIIC